MRKIIMCLVGVTVLNLTGLFTAVAGPAAVRGSKVAPSKAHEDWKGPPDEHEFTFGATLGAGVMDSTVGFALMGMGAKKIIPQGFVPDINNSVWIEAELGPLFFSEGTAFTYGIHLRWDFKKDPEWTFFALGGVGGVVGNITAASLGSRFLFYPRFGAGVFWKPEKLPFSLRGELSHELMTVGASFSI